MTKEMKISYNLLPRYPSIFPIIRTIRNKYNVPEIEPSDHYWLEIFLRDEEQEINCNFDSTSSAHR